MKIIINDDDVLFFLLSYADTLTPALSLSLSRSPAVLFLSGDYYASHCLLTFSSATNWRWFF